MQLKLSEQKGVQILAILGDIDSRGFAVLKAGLTKIFKTGKNKIILELKGVTKVEPACLKALAEMNVLARELAGQIVFASGSPEIVKTAQSTGAPPPVPCFTTLELALLSFEKIPATQAATPAPVKATPAQPAAPVQKTAAQPSPPATADAHLPGTPGLTEPQISQRAKEQIEELKRKLQEMETGELAQLRADLSSAKEEVTRLRDLLGKMFMERKTPPDEESMKETIKRLETQIEALSSPTTTK